MTRHKKTVHATRRALDKAIEQYRGRGWEVERTEALPRGITGRMTYIAYLKRDTQ